MEIRELLEEALEANGYDGLYQHGVCACRKGDLMPCGEPGAQCMAGRLIDVGSCCGASFHIGRDSGKYGCSYGE
jgi:hypothetical protein